ncbi:MAG TPA: penicillin-binding transpeptidase domain-containing protein [Gaiellaceae bacterium]|nr:penicillin-binding transpeptidase domain-containing protein [Gaiellaceae bacterium]
MNRQISTVALATLVMLAALIVATTYWQTWAAPGLAARQDNAIQRVAQFEVRRGFIYASDGKTILARNVREKSGGQTLYFRTYPTNGFASQVIGYSTQSRARAGLEESENDYLTGSNKDLGTFIDTLGDKLQGTTVQGNSLVLTLNVKAQKVAESELAGKCGAAVVWNPTTGAVLAMASSPTYNPNLVEKPNGYQQILSAKSKACADASPLLNRATQGLYPPGSTFKTITAAAALDDGVYTPTSTFYDPGYCTEYGKQVYNADDQSGGHEAFGNVTLAEAYQHSINAVFCNIGQKLTSARLLNEAKKFGFYTVPPLETPSDARSASGLYKGSKLYDPKDPDRFVDPGRTAFGQGQMLVTPLQMAMVAGAVANGGVMMKPYVVKKVVSPSGSVVARTKSHVLRTPITPKTAAALNQMMVSVVTGGTGTEAQIPGVTVAGKTGTAETNKPGVYDAWFIFFAPAEHPTVAGAVVVQDVPGGFGGAISAPIAKALMQAILPTTSNTNP